jgi:hypothetical protein
MRFIRNPHILLQQLVYIFTSWLQSVKRFVLFYRRLARLEYAPSCAVATAASATGGPGRAWTTAGSPIGHSA